jgi:hypothetical protein
MQAMRRRSSVSYAPGVAGIAEGPGLPGSVMALKGGNGQPLNPENMTPEEIEDMIRRLQVGASRRVAVMHDAWPIILMATRSSLTESR